MKRFTENVFSLLVGLVLMLSATAFPGRLSAQDTGSSGAVTLVEYSDYQCPACAYFHPIVKKLKDHFGDRLKVEYRYFPLNSHQYAALAARAAQAAKNQDKFLQMHNMLFENQDRWASAGNPQSIFTGYAKKIGLNLDQFQNDLNAAETQKTVMEERQQGRNMGVDATPTFFINGEKMMQLPQSFEEFKALVEIYMGESDRGNE